MTMMMMSMMMSKLTYRLPWSLCLLERASRTATSLLPPAPPHPEHQQQQHRHRQEAHGRLEGGQHPVPLVIVLALLLVPSLAALGTYRVKS